MKVSQFQYNFHSRELFQWLAVLTLFRCCIGDVIGVPHGIWPQADQDHPLPFIHHIEHGSPGLFLQVPDASLRYAILEVGI